MIGLTLVPILSQTLIKELATKSYLSQSQSEITRLLGYWCILSSNILQKTRYFHVTLKSKSVWDESQQKIWIYWVGGLNATL